MMDLFLYPLSYTVIAIFCLGLAWLLTGKTRGLPVIYLLGFICVNTLCSITPSFFGVFFWETGTGLARSFR